MEIPTVWSVNSTRTRPGKRKVSSPVLNEQPSKLIAFGWYGGKYSHLEWLLPLLPKCHHYCEPFAGSAAVLLNRPPSPVETYNDLDDEVANFFRILRDEAEQLTRAIGLTPFSRAEFAKACAHEVEPSPIERARSFYVRARQVRIGLAQTASVGRWANCIDTSRAGMAGAVSRWLGGVTDLPAIAERLLRVQIEHRPALDVLKLYDTPNTLFYCDPPYVHATRGDSKAYRHEMTDADHRVLAATLNQVQGKVAISNYDCALMDELYPAPRWHKQVAPAKTTHTTKEQRVEVLWTNYDPTEHLLQNFWNMEIPNMTTPIDILNRLTTRAQAALSTPLVQDTAIQQQVDYLCRELRNRACVRLLMSCLLAKLDRPAVDLRKPYTEIDSADAYSGRHYDERYLTHLIHEQRLPLNPTTAFLTPALRNLDRPLTLELELVGEPRRLYQEMLLLLDAAHTGKVAVEDLLAETIRLLLVIRNERDARMASLMAGLQHQAETPPLSSEEIVTLIEQHLRNKKSARLPVLVVAAAYRAVGKRIGERVLPLQSHTAADEQTGALGDLEVCLENDQQIVTAYEMKMKKVTIDDLDRALQKIALFKAEPVKARLHNYIFITTDLIPADVQRYAAELYNQTGGTEIAILDCIGFLRHFLHFFHRARLNFVDAYQELVLAEPESGVSQPLKEAFLALRQAAESDE